MTTIAKRSTKLTQVTIAAYNAYTTAINAERDYNAKTADAKTALLAMQAAFSAAYKSPYDAQQHMAEAFKASMPDASPEAQRKAWQRARQMAGIELVKSDRPEAQAKADKRAEAKAKLSDVAYIATQQQRMAELSKATAKRPATADELKESKALADFLIKVAEAQAKADKRAEAKAKQVNDDEAFAKWCAKHRKAIEAMSAEIEAWKAPNARPNPSKSTKTA